MTWRIKATEKCKLRLKNPQQIESSISSSLISTMDILAYSLSFFCLFVFVLSIKFATSSGSVLKKIFELL